VNQFDDVNASAIALQFPILVSWSIQNGSRSRRLRTLPAPDFGKRLGAYGRREPRMLEWINYGLHRGAPVDDQRW